MGIRWLRQLDGMKVEALLQAEGITSKDVAELQRLIGLLGSVKSVPSSPAQRTPKHLPTVLRHRKPPETIVIPPESRDQPIAAFKFSTRLGHILGYQGIRVLGDLHGRSYQELLEFRNYGRKTVNELREIVRSVQGNAPSGTESQVLEITALLDPDLLLIPDHSQEVALSDLDISGRLAHGLDKLRIMRLGDLHARHLREFREQRNIGRTSLAELRRLAERAQAGEFNPDSVALASHPPVRVVPLLDRLLAQIHKSKYRDILRFRFGAETGQFAALQKAGSRFGRSAEAIRHIVGNQLDKMRKQGGQTLRHLLDKIALDCCEAVRPLTPDLLAAWLKNSGTPASCHPAFYLRLLGALSPQIPIWLTGQNPVVHKAEWDDDIRRILQAGLEAGRSGLPLPEVFASLRGNQRYRQLRPREFLDHLQNNSRLPVVFSDPHQPELRLDRVTPACVIRLVLLASEKPLRPEEIVTRAQARFGAESFNLKQRSLAHILTPENGFYLLGRLSFGLRQHFQLPQRLWPRARADFAQFLEKVKRPVSTPEIINGSVFPWTSQTNASELAQILREDKTFADLGRFLFALATWGVAERAHVKDLIPQVLAEAGRPLKVSQMVEQLTRLRSISPHALADQLRRHPLVREVRPHCFGLKSWDKTGRAPATPDGGPG